MASTTVRLAESARQVLRELADQSGDSMSTVLEKAIECYRRQRFLEDANAGFTALRANPEEWRDELEERQAWEATLGDGLDDEGGSDE
ncbi:MAG TPA: toxin-antitoxin system protein [Armatimonadota bacterium]|nr:toxin-antitoxin system protein [Armatimonadota bacterium]HQK91972.1 toxin-antitoxin system protein [Armatimonadota bacterium]